MLGIRIAIANSNPTKEKRFCDLQTNVSNSMMFNPEQSEHSIKKSGEVGLSCLLEFKLFS